MFSPSLRSAVASDSFETSASSAANASLLKLSVVTPAIWRRRFMLSMVSTAPRTNPTNCTAEKPVASPVRTEPSADALVLSPSSERFTDVMPSRVESLIPISKVDLTLRAMVLPQ